MMSRFWRFFLVSCLLIAGFALMACGTPATIRPLSAAFLPLPSDKPIAMTEGEFAQPYTPIAEVTTEPFAEQTVDVSGQAQLKTIARSLGGDGIVRLRRTELVREEFGYCPGALLRLGTRFVDRYTLSGIVVRLADKP